MPIIKFSDYKLLSQRLSVGNTELAGIHILMFGQETMGFMLPHIIGIESIKEELVKEALKNSKFELVTSYTKKKKQSKKSKLISFDNFIDDSGYESFVFKTEYIEDKKIENPILFKLTEGRKGYEFLATCFNKEDLEAFCSHIEKKYSDAKNYDEETNFGILINQEGSTYIKEMEIDDKFSAKLDLGLNYGKKFPEIHDKIVSKLKETNNGLFILHGASGTGKTTYIKYLARIFGGEKMFIFIPTTFVDALVSPAILSILLDKPNSVLVLEDAEKAVVSREHGEGNESLVSSLLNIGDGILGSMLNISIILTFNTSKERIDKALLRKGRLHYEYEFKELEIDDAQNLVSTFNKGYKVTKPMSLAEIYNIDHDNNHREVERGKIGFGV